MASPYSVSMGSFRRQRDSDAGRILQRVTVVVPEASHLRWSVVLEQDPRQRWTGSARSRCSRKRDASHEKKTRALDQVACAGQTHSRPPSSLPLSLRLRAG